MANTPFMETVANLFGSFWPFVDLEARSIARRAESIAKSSSVILAVSKKPPGGKARSIARRAESIALYGESIALYGESIATYTNENAIYSIPSEGERKVHNIVRNLNTQDFILDWEI